MHKFPEEIGRVSVGVATGGRANTWVEADEHADEVWSDGVGEVVHDVGVFVWRSVAR